MLQFTVMELYSCTVGGINIVGAYEILCGK